MSRVRIAALCLGLAAPVVGQAQDHAHHAPAAPPVAPAAADPHAGHNMAPAEADPHAGHTMAPAAADPHAGHTMPALNPPSAPLAPPPPTPTDHAADRLFDPVQMAAARDQLRLEHGGGAYWMVLANIAEWSPRQGGDGYGWEGEAWFGGDIHRLILKSEGEGRSGHGLEQAEVQALYARAIGPYFNLHAGVRQDIEPRPRRTYATLGLEGLAPTWFEVEATGFVSHRGDLSGRVEGYYDWRLSQRLILQPRGEVNIAADDDTAIGVGSGLSDFELALRLRYEIRREFAPYVGLVHDRKLGRTADLARQAGEDVADTRLVIGVRAWF